MADLAASAMALRTVIRQLPDQAWSFRLKIQPAEPFPAAQMPIRRLVEVELHHCDLGIGYDASSWPSGFTEMPLPEPMHSQRQERMSYPPQSYQATPSRPNRPWPRPACPAARHDPPLAERRPGPGLMRRPGNA